MITVFRAGGEAHHAAWEFDDVTADIQRIVPERLLAEITLCIGHEVQHFLRNRAGCAGAWRRSLAAEQVERHTVWCRVANVHVAKRNSQFGRVMGVELLLEASVVAVAVRPVTPEALIAATLS